MAALGLGVGFFDFAFGFRNSRPACGPGSSIAGRAVRAAFFGYFDQPFGLLKSASLPFKEK
ncbi:hypothetical protein [Pseudoxanthomonas yeongjuensis]|uniref:hypothetical protein n=1 Tax=Pseudoxanthomonas yeongjuensis TaxID=377616 RepID=UPI0013917ACF|nr:hypothetical protein [Pseudoxanthomonas yeongjuensis]